MNRKIIDLSNASAYRLTRRWSYDWTAISEDLGIAFPAEYEEYVSYFPPGTYGGVITPLHPGTREGSLGLRDRMTLVADVLREALPAVGTTPAVYYPEPGGFIPWAMYESVVALCWLPEGDDPDRWPVYACDDQHQRARIPGSMIEALLHVLRKEAGRTVFPQTFYDELDLYGEPLAFDSAEKHPLVTLPPAQPLHSVEDGREG